MKKLLLLSLCLMMCAITQLYAQTRTVTGIVTGRDDGKPLPGVTVKIKNTNNGTQTDVNGRYSLSVPEKATLVFSFVGYDNQEAFPKGDATNVTLAPSQNSLNEVVVVGYGSIERRSITGAVAGPVGTPVGNLPAPSFDKDLAGRITGVRVTESSGLLGTAPVIRVRGDNSINGNSAPLYVVDGVPIQTGNQSGVVSNNPLGDINPSDIQSVEVLKDGSASAIYGSRASGGVVLITTKKGKAGRQTINYDGWVGFTETSKRLKVLNAADFITINNEKFTNAGLTAPAVASVDPATNQPYDTNWQNVIFRKGFQENHALSVSGGTDNSSYYFSGGFSDFKGQVVDNSQRRYTFRSNVEQKALNKHLTIGLNLGATYVKNLGLNTGTNSLSGNVTNALLVFPNVGVYNPDGSYNLSADNSTLGQGANLRKIDNNYTNIKYVLDHNINQTQNLALNGSAFIDAKIINGLNVRSQIGLQSLYNEDYQYLDPLHGDGRSSVGAIFQQYIPNVTYVWTNTLTYNRTFGNHSINFVAGNELQKYRNRSFYANGTGLSNTYFGINNNIISNTLTTPTIGGDISETAIRSFFGRLNYSYLDRYIITATYRTDYNSVLGIASKPGKFPGISGGWRISNENFFKSSKALSFISDLKLRGGYARVGNQGIAGGSYPFVSTYGPVSYGNESGVQFNVLGNNALKYETIDKVDIGLDMGLFKNRIVLTADIYKNTDNNLVLGVPIAPSLGVPGNVISENIGTMYNKGLEIGINARTYSSKNFNWTTDLNLTFTKNQVTSLPAGTITGTYNYVIQGYSKNVFYGYQYMGVNPANGNPLWQKANGTIIQGAVANGAYTTYDPNNPSAAGTASTLSLDDKRVLGNSVPTYFGGFNNTFTYKNIDLTIFLTFSGGNKIFNATAQENLYNQLFNNNGVGILNRWTPTNTNTDVPKLYYGSSTNINLTGNTTSRFLENGRFIRGQEIRLGYSVPKSFINAAAINNLHFYGMVQNVFTITKYKGLDPEGYNTGTGVDFNANPRPRTFVFGVNVGF